MTLRLTFASAINSAHANAPCSTGQQVGNRYCKAIHQRQTLVQASALTKDRQARAHVGINLTVANITTKLTKQFISFISFTAMTEHLRYVYSFPRLIQDIITFGGGTPLLEGTMAMDAPIPTNRMQKNAKGGHRVHCIRMLHT